MTQVIEVKKSMDEILSENEALKRENAELKRKNKSLQELEYDEVTGLYCRKVFDQEALRLIERAKKNSRPVSYLLIDVDFFKKINDAYGHSVGDEVLRYIADTLQSNVRANPITKRNDGVKDLVGRIKDTKEETVETKMGRWGGEEFAILVYNTTAQDAYGIAERLRKKIRNKSYVTKNGTKIPITISIGVATTENLYTGTTENVLANIQQGADKALYTAKGNGRNRTELSSRDTNNVGSLHKYVRLSRTSHTYKGVAA